MLNATAVRLGPPDTTARGRDAIEDAAGRVAASGRTMHVFHQDPSDPRAAEEGWELLRVSIIEDGYQWKERQGVRWVEPEGECAYIKVIWVSEETIAERAADPISWRFAFGGWYGPHDTLEECWQTVGPYAGWATSREVTATEMEADLAKAGAKEAAAYAHWLEQVRQPWVEYVNVAPERRRLGLAVALYQAAAGYLGSLGMALRSSTLQSPEAAAVWEHCAGLWDLKRRPHTKTGSEVYALDLRGSGAARFCESTAEPEID